MRVLRLVAVTAITVAIPETVRRFAALTLTGAFRRGLFSMKLITRTLIALSSLSMLPAASAALYRLDVSGEIVADAAAGAAAGDTFGSFSISMLLDSSAPDFRPEPNSARFRPGVVGGQATWNGELYNHTPVTFNDVFVNNNPLNDLFAALGAFVGSDGGSFFFEIVLRDSSGSAFGSDAFPLALELDSFDAFDLNAPGGTGVGFLPGGVPGQIGRIDTLNYYVVPLPAGIWLLLSALGSAGIAGRISNMRRVADA